MTFDAGSIEATLDLDRTPMQRGLAAARREGEEWARQRYTAKLDVDVDTRKGQAAIRQMLRDLDREVHKKIKIETDVSQISRATAAATSSIQQTQQAAKQASNETADQLNLLLDSAIALGPALIPLASGLAGISSSVVGIGANVALGFKGAALEIKEGTATGLEFTRTLNKANAAVTTLERSAARGILKPFEDTVDKLADRLPELNAFVERTAPTTGRILESGANSLLNLFQAAEPLIESAQASVAEMLDKLENWTASPEAVQFFDTLKDDIPLAVETIGDLATAGAHLIQAFNPVGEVILEGVDAAADFINVLDRVPGLLTALATGLVAWKVGSLASAAAGRLAAAAGLSVATAAEREAAAASAAAAAEERLALARRQAGLAGATGGLPGWGGMRYGPGAVPIGGAGVPATPRPGIIARGGAGALRALPWILAGEVGLGALNKGINTQGGSSNALVGGFKSSLAGLQDFATGNWDFSGARASFGASRQARQNQSYQREVDAYLNRYVGLTGGSIMGSSYGGRASARGGGNRFSTAANLIGNNQSAQYATDPLFYKQSYGYRYQQRNEKVVDSQMAALGRQTDPQQISQGNDAITSSIQKRIDAEKELFDTSGKQIKLTDGLTVSQDAYLKKMKENGGSLQDTINYFRGHQEAMKNDQDALREITARQGRYNDFLTDAQTKYKLSANEVKTYTSALGLNYEAITNSTMSQKESAKVLDLVHDKFANGNQAVQGWLGAMQNVDTESDSLTQKVGLLGAALKALQGTKLAEATSNLSAVAGAENAANAIDKNSKSISKNGNLLGQLVKVGDEWIVKQPKLTAGSLETAQAMSQAGDSAISLAQSIYQNTGSADQALAAYEGLRKQFISTEVQSGRTRKAAKNLATQIYGVPKDARTFVDLLNKNNVAAAIRSLTGQLVKFGNTVSVALLGLKGDDEASGSLNHLLSQLAQTEGTHYIDLITRKMTITRGADQQNNRNDTKVPGAAGLIAYSYAIGGVDPGDKKNGHLPTVSAASRPGMVRVWAEPETKGEVYAPLANDWRRPRAKSVIEYAVDKFGGEVQWYAGGGYNPPSLITSGGSGGGGGGKSSGSSSSSSNAKKTPKIDWDSYISMLTTSLSSLAGAGSASAKDLKKTLDAIDDTLEKIRKKDLSGSGSVRAFERESKDLVRLAKQRSDLLERYDKDKARRDRYQQLYNNERSTVRGSVLGSFNVASEGNGYLYGIQSSLKTDLSNATKFEKLRDQAKKLGLDKGLIRQLTENEDDPNAMANLEAIVKGGSKAVTGINRDYNSLRAVSTRLGTSQARDLYGKNLDRYTKATNVLHHQIKKTDEKMAGELAAIGDLLRKMRADFKSKKRTR